MMDPIRILYLSDTGGQMGGAAVSLVSLVKRLDRSQFAPHALLGSDGDLADALRGLGVDVTVAELDPIVRSYCPIVLLRSLRRLVRGCRSVMSLCRAKRIDLIHANDNTVVFFAVIPAWITMRKSAWHVRSAVSKLGCIGGWLVRHCDAIIFCSESNAAPFRKYARYERKMHVAHEGVDVPALIEESNRPSIRAEYHIPANTPLVGIVGRIARIKGQDEFLKAALVLSNLHPLARYVVAGAPVAGSRDALSADVAYEKEIRRLADKIGITEKVIFTGYRHDVPAVMKDLTVLAVPSRQEGLGIVALEAMALGVPVVASNAGGLPEIIKNEVNGLIVPIDAAGALGMAISRLLGDPDLAKRLGEEGRRTVAARFTADAHAKIVADLYRKIMGTSK